MTLQREALLLTAEEFAELDDPGPADLVRGRVVYLVKPKPLHGRIVMRISVSMAVFVRDRKLGEVYAAETGFLIERDPDTVRAPDVAFVRSELAGGHDDEQWYEHAPDLAVEVVSPSDRAGAIKAKANMWLEHGSRSVWVVDPAGRSATIYRADGGVESISADGILKDDAILPGFSLELASVFG